MMKMKGNNKFDINKTEFLGSLKQKECYIIINVDEKNGKITLTVSDDLDIDKLPLLEEKIKSIVLGVFGKFYGNKCLIIIGSVIPHYLAEMLRMLCIDAKMNEEKYEVEFWTSKEKASFYLSYTINLEDIPDINFAILWGAVTIYEIFKDKYPKEYELIEDRNIAIAILDHVVSDIRILDETREIEFLRQMAEHLSENEFTYTIKNEEKWGKFFEFLNRAFKQKGLKAKIINNKTMEVKND